MKYTEIIERLESLRNPENIIGMARFGINPENNYGISIPNLRNMARQIHKNRLLAQQLWSSGIRDARILACMIDEPQNVTRTQMESWVEDFDSWDLCDQCCNNLFVKTGFAYQKAIEWAQRREEFIKRAGFVLMALLAVHDKKAGDSQFGQFFPLIKKEAIDKRNFVKKAVNWALRQIGKRNRTLNKIAVKVAEEIQQFDSKAAKWIAGNAWKELTSDKVQQRLRS